MLFGGIIYVMYVYGREIQVLYTLTFILVDGGGSAPEKANHID